jgi:tRNA (guanine-N7-)-methyltransferase
MSEAPPPHFRTVRSYVRRSGRVTSSQARALSEYWPRFGLDFRLQTVDLDALFGRTALRTLEIGFGNGEQLLARAMAEPERDFLGVEVHRSGVGQLLNAAMAGALSNIRVACHDAIEVLKVQIAAAALDEVQILFPDPWPKERHHKRRLIQPEFVELLATRLRSGGRLLLATDWAPYAEHMRLILDACPLFERLDTGATEAGAATARTQTRFERRGVLLGHAVSDFCYRRR